MLAWLISQHNDATGETNVTFITAPDVNVDDYTIKSGSWKNAPVKVRAIQIETVDPFEDLTDLNDQVYRNDGFVDAEAAWETVSDETIASALRQLKEVYR
jgi:hypothetical protein